MKKQTMGTFFSMVTISALLIGCGGSSSAVQKTEKTTFTFGQVFDDYIAGATVCGDKAPHNGKQDADEICTTTDENGIFKFNTAISDPLVMFGGVDIGTKQAFKGTFTAPAGSNVINPLTTIVNSIMTIGDTNLTVAEAQAIVKEKLNLPATIDLSTFDPFSELVYGDDDTAKENAKAVLAQQSSIQVILSLVATTIAASSDAIEESDVTENATDKIALLMLTANENNEDFTITSEENIKEILTIAKEETFNEAVNEGTITQAIADTAEAKVTVDVIVAVAQKVEVTAKAVVENIEKINVTEADAGLDAIKAANTVLLLVTDADENNPRSIVNLIGEAVVGTNIDPLENVNITTAIEEQEATIPERPEVPEQEEEAVITGAEGGN